MIFYSGLELKKIQTAVSKHLGILPSFSTWFVVWCCVMILWNVMVSSLVSHVVRWSINSFSFIKWLFSTPQTSLQCLGKLTAKQGIVIRWICFLRWNWCNIFNGLYSRTVRILYLVNLLFLKVIFILISLVLLVEISNSCVSGE